MIQQNWPCARRPVSNPVWHVPRIRNSCWNGERHCGCLQMNENETPLIHDLCGLNDDPFLVRCEEWVSEWVSLLSENVQAVQAFLLSLTFLERTQRPLFSLRPVSFAAQQVDLKRKKRTSPLVAIVISSHRTADKIVNRSSSSRKWRPQPSRWSSSTSPDGSGGLFFSTVHYSLGLQSWGVSNL